MNQIAPQLSGLCQHTGLHVDYEVRMELRTSGILKIILPVRTLAIETSYIESTQGSLISRSVRLAFDLAILFASMLWGQAET